MGGYTERRKCKGMYSYVRELRIIAVKNRLQCTGERERENIEPMNEDESVDTERL